jgi:hypothetical protein
MKMVNPKSTILNSKFLSSVLAAGLLSAWAVPALARERLGNDLIQFPEDTIVEFEVQFTQGANRSEFGVMLDPASPLDEVTEVATFDNLKARGKFVPLFIETRAFDRKATQHPRWRFSGYGEWGNCD